MRFPQTGLQHRIWILPVNPFQPTQCENWVDVRSKWVLGSSGGHGILTHFFLESSQTIGVSLGFTTEKLNFSRPSLWNCGRVAGPPTASSMDPHPIHTKRIPKARLHVNASKFNSLNNVLKPKKKCFRTFLSTSNLVKIQLPTFPATSAPSQHHRCPVPLHPAFDLVRHWKKLLKADLYNESLLLMLFLISTG